MSIPMHLLVDGGSTKTHWRLFSRASNCLHEWTSPGINPYFQTADEVIAEQKATAQQELEGYSLSSILFYGSGVSSSLGRERIQGLMNLLCPEGEIHLHHDMLGAARALCQHSAGVVIILGTGANACSYDGEAIKSSAVSLGFMLSDEGSGTLLGKALVTAYFRNHCPTHLRKAFEDQHAPQLVDTLDRLYRQPYPNRYLASFAPFLLQRLHDPWCYGIVKQQFDQFVSEYVLPLPETQQYPMYATGSVAWHGRQILNQSLKEKHLPEATVMASPMDGLIGYHQSQQT